MESLEHDGKSVRIPRLQLLHLLGVAEFLQVRVGGARAIITHIVSCDTHAPSTRTISIPQRKWKNLGKKFIS